MINPVASGTVDLRSVAARLAHGGVPDVEAYVPTLPRPHLIDRWPVPDRNHPALRRVLNAPSSTTKTMVLAPDGTWLAGAGSYEDIWLSDTTTGETRGHLRTGAGYVSGLALSPDGTRLASVSGSAVQVWQVATSRQEVGARMPEEAFRCAWLPDGSGLCVAGKDGVHLLDLVGS
jgi:WD40 repeat protein